jgi:hypothetical protein
MRRTGQERRHVNFRQTRPETTSAPEHAAHRSPTVYRLPPQTEGNTMRQSTELTRIRALMQKIKAAKDDDEHLRLTNDLYVAIAVKPWDDLPDLNEVEAKLKRQQHG